VNTDPDARLKAGLALVILVTAALIFGLLFFGGGSL
jgi:hypothetical protein